MRMIDFDLEVQKQVISAGLDDFSPNAMLPATHGGQFGATPAAWRNAVIALICSMLDAGLIVPNSGMGNYHEKSTSQIADLLTHGDADNGLDRDVVCDAVHFFGTPKLLALLQMLELDNWEALQCGLSAALGGALAEMNVVRV